MRTLFLIICWITLAAIPARTQTPASAIQSTRPTSGVQKIKITDLESYIAHSDHPLIVSFWATFCGPCCKEIPYFQSTTQRYKEQGVELILVSLDLPDYYPARIAAFAKKSDFTARILWLNETNADYFCPKVDPHWSGGIPCSLFINNAAHYRRFFDRQLTERQIEPEIKEMLVHTTHA